MNGATLTADRFGIPSSAYNFDGIDDFIEVANSESNTITGDITLAAWIHTMGSNGQNYQTVISKRETYWTWEYALALSYHEGIIHDTKALFARALGMGNGEQVWSDTPYEANNWEFWTVTLSSGEAKLYKNGELDYSAPFNLVPNTQDCPLLFGKNTLVDDSEQFYGLIDDIGIWNRALTECEIAALYAAESNTTVSVSAGADLSICLGDSIVLSASGGDSSYTWSNGIEDGVAFVPDSSSYFTVEGSLGACTSTDTVFVEVLQPTTGMDTQVACDSLTWLDGITYTASTNEPFIALTNAAGCDSIVTLDLTVNYTTYNTIDTTVVNVLEYNGEEYTEGGEYLVYLENEAGCDSIITLKLTVEYVGVDDLETQGNWSVYPNPIESQLTIASANLSEVHLVQIFNALGQVVWSDKVSSQVTIEVDSWPRGMYVVELRDEAVSTRERIPILVK